MMPIHAVPVLAAGSISPWMAYIIAIVAGVASLVAFAIFWILRSEFKHSEEDLKLLYPEQPEPEEGGSGKRPGQFGIFDLLVLMTFAGVACAILRLPIHFTLKMLVIMMVWVGFSRWALGKPDARKLRSLAFKRRAAILHAVGSVLSITPFVWNMFEQSSRLPVAARTGFTLSMLLFPLLAIWKAGCAVSAEYAAGRSRKQRLA